MIRPGNEGLFRMQDICAAARRLEGGRLSLHWDDRDVEITFIREDGGWFWCAYDRTARRTRDCARAAKLEAAVEQAFDALNRPDGSSKTQSPPQSTSPSPQPGFPIAASA